MVDLVRMKAYTYELGGNGKGKETEIPANMKAQVQEAHERLVELVAEGDDKLMEKFFEEGTLGEEDLIPALHNAIREDKIFPVIFSSGLGNIGADRVMDFIVDYTPAPSEHEWVQGEAGGNGDAPKRHETDAEPVSLYVFKTVSDAFAGPDFVLQSFLRRAEERCDAAELQPQRAGKVRAHFDHAGEDGGSGDRAACRRYWRGGETERHADRRHAGRQVGADSVSAGEAAGAGDHVCHRAQEPRR